MGKHNKQKPIKYRDLTEEEMTWLSKNQERLIEENKDVEMLIKGYVLQRDNVAIIAEKELMECQKKIAELNEQATKLVADLKERKISEDEFKIEKDYTAYLIEQQYHQLNGGTLVYYKMKARELDGAVKEHQKIVNTNTEVLVDINKKLTDKKVEVRKK